VRGAPGTTADGVRLSRDNEGCVVLRQLALATRTGAASEIVAEGLLIVGWVAMWRPLEIFLYEWWPIRRRCWILAKLAKISVIVRGTKG
jgi:hypothetical protein